MSTELCRICGEKPATSPDYPGVCRWEVCERQAAAERYFAAGVPGTPELGCVDCGWTGNKRRFDGDKAGALYYHNQHAYECPSCGSDVIPYAEWLTEKAEDR